MGPINNMVGAVTTTMTTMNEGLSERLDTVIALLRENNALLAALVKQGEKGED